MLTWTHTFSHQHVSHLALIDPPPFFCVFQGDVNVHMVYKSAGQDVSNDLLNGKILTEDMFIL